MQEGKSYLPWPRVDDRTVVEEMLRDDKSGQWYECREFVKKRVQIQAKNIPRDQWEDIVQDTMIRIDRALPTFQHQCALRTWLFGIVRSSVIDAYRKHSRVGQFLTHADDPQDDVEHEDNAFTPHAPGAVEDVCITQDELEKALAALQEYMVTHANPVRNGKILDLVIFEGRSLEEAAKAVGCSAPIVGYVVRSAQRYVRDKLGKQR